MESVLDYLRHVSRSSFTPFGSPLCDKFYRYVPYWCILVISLIVRLDQLLVEVSIVVTVVGWIIRFAFLFRDFVVLVVWNLAWMIMVVLVMEDFLVWWWFECFTYHKVYNSCIDHVFLLLQHGSDFLVVT